MNLEDLLRQKREEILRIAAKHGARDVRVFGSVARGEEDTLSDVDFLVELEPGRSLLDLGGLQFDLDELLQTWFLRQLQIIGEAARSLPEDVRALFKSWFVDFDPVIDNALRAGKRIPDALAEKAARRKAALAKARAEGWDSPFPKHIADLFPDEFQDSPLGPIPKGWRVRTVGEEFELTMGQSPPGDTYNDRGKGLPFFQGRKDFGFRYPNNSIFCVQPKRLANRDGTLVSVRAPVGDINMAAERCCIGRGVAALRHRSGSRSYTYYFMDKLRVAFARFDVEGTVFGAITKAQFHAIECIAPLEPLVV